MGLRAVWDGQAEEWAAFARSPELDRHFWAFNLPLFLDLVPEAGRLTVDVGCGEGRLTAELARRGHRVVGVDGSPKMAGIARRRGLDRLVNADAAAIEEAGLLIERLREPRPPEAVVAGTPSLERWRRVPCFLHLRAVKA
jgi:SAM-dependent methyltransferase